MTRDLCLLAPIGDFEDVDVSMAFTLASGDQVKSPVFRKELAYQGRFVKFKPGTRDPEFELPVDETQIDHWVNTFRVMKKNGIEVPMPIGHTTEPERRRGTVVDLRKEENPNRPGGFSLYAYCAFNDEQTASKLKNSNVSLFMPPKFDDGKGRRYIRPIRHVAITDYPVVPGLSPFQNIAASFELSLADEEEEMAGLTWAQVAQELGIEAPEGGDDNAAKEAVLQAWDAGGEGGDTEGGDTETEGDDIDVEDDDVPAIDEDDNYGADDGGDFTDEGDDEQRTQGGPPAMSQAPIAASLVRREASNRVEVLRGLVRTGRVSPAAAKRLSQRYCSVENVNIALSLEQDGNLDAAGDDFDEVIAALSLNPEGSVAHTGARTGPQIDRAEKSPIVVEAEKRSKR
jgi:hypothetical protein